MCYQYRFASKTTQLYTSSSGSHQHDMPFLHHVHSKLHPRVVVQPSPSTSEAQPHFPSLHSLAHQAINTQHDPNSRDDVCRACYDTAGKRRPVWRVRKVTLQNLQKRCCNNHLHVLLSICFFNSLLTPFVVFLQSLVHMQFIINRNRWLRSIQHSFLTAVKGSQV